MDESAKVHENYEMVTDPVTGEKKKSLLPTIFHDSMTDKVAKYRGFAFEMNEQDPWFMFFSRAAGLALLVMTLGNNQMLRAIFLVGEGAPEMEIDPTQFAIGNNLLRSYDLSPGSKTSRLSIYWRNNGGRIRESFQTLAVLGVPDLDRSVVGA